MPDTTEKNTPEWLTETPRELEYFLEVFADGGEALQEITISRDEYETLKHRLAQLRGLEEQPRNGDIIRQAEIENLRRLEIAFTTAILSVRRRLAAGAAVEPGEWTINSDHTDIEEYAAEETVGFSIAGLDVSPS
jgi:hypothetical protein